MTKSHKKDDSLEQNLLKELVCPLCGVYMTPPIQQCTAGHNFCKECFELLSHCTKCYSSKGTTRNHTLEKIYYRVKLPCKYACNGCEYMGKSDKLADHEAICTYTIRRCPFTFTSLCSWNGVIYDIQEHCNEFHNFSVMVGSENAKSFFQFDTFPDGYAMYMIFALNTLFRFTSFIDKNTRMMKFATTYLGRKLEDNRYSYEVKFLRNGTEKAAITLKAVCEFLSDHTKPFSGQNYLILPLEVLQPFCDRQGDLHYVIRMIDNGENAALSKPSTSKMSD